MRLIKASTTILVRPAAAEILNIIEVCGRITHKSPSNYTVETGKEFAKMLIERGHESVLEHASMSVLFIVDRGVSHELVRHRLASFTQESTRYCNYAKQGDNCGIAYIVPEWFEADITIPAELDKYCTINEAAKLWFQAMNFAENSYLALIKAGWSAQKARSVLPNALKTEIVVTANLREWRHILKLRTSKAAHPQMREVMIPC